MCDRNLTIESFSKENWKDMVTLLLDDKRELTEKCVRLAAEMNVFKTALKDRRVDVFSEVENTQNRILTELYQRRALEDELNKRIDKLTILVSTTRAPVQITIAVQTENENSDICVRNLPSQELKNGSAHTKAENKRKKPPPGHKASWNLFLIVA